MCITMMFKCGILCNSGEGIFAIQSSTNINEFMLGSVPQSHSFVRLRALCYYVICIFLIFHPSMGLEMEISRKALNLCVTVPMYPFKKKKKITQSINN